MSGDRADHLAARAVARDVVERLVEAGHEAYFAGGCVRDELLGQAPVDYDVATSASPEVVKSLFRSARGVGEAFGVMLVRARGHTVEVATFRTDGVYADGRHPDRVTFSDARHDASRRDFTINGLFENPLTDEIIDYVGGRADLEARVVRAIGDPIARLREDQLRMLRAVRFAARFGFAIEQATAEAIRAAASGLRGVSRERIGQEVRAMLSDPNRAVAAWEMQYLELDSAALSEEHRLEAPQRLGRLPDQVAYPTALAAWLIDRWEHEPQRWDDRIAGWARALVLPTADEREVAATIRAYRVLRGPWPGLGVARQKRLAADRIFPAALLLVKSESNQQFVDIQRAVVELARRGGLAPEPLLTGDDLIAAGFEAGPLFRRILDGVYDAQLEGSIGSLAEALSLAEAIRRTS